MKALAVAVACIASLASLAALAAAQDPNAAEEPKLSRTAVCTAIADREPVGAPEKEPYEFKADVGQVYFFNELTLGKPPQTVVHRYSVDGKIVSEVKLSLKTERTRTWSSKKVWPGSWKVEALSESGKVLGSASFKVSP